MTRAASPTPKSRLLRLKMAAKIISGQPNASEPLTDTALDVAASSVRLATAAAIAWPRSWLHPLLCGGGSTTSHLPRARGGGRPGPAGAPPQPLPARRRGSGGLAGDAVRAESLQRADAARLADGGLIWNQIRRSGHQ